MSLPTWLKGSIAAVVAASACLGCTELMAVDLLTVTGASPAQLRPGDVLVVEGAGFAAGRPADVVFAGTIRRPGQAPRPGTAVTVTGRSVSAHRLEVVITPELIHAMGGRGTFTGALRVEFPAATGRSRVTGTLADLQLSFFSPTAERLRSEVVNSRQASSLLMRIGVAVEEDDAEGRGLGVAHVVAGSPADVSGLMKGDRLVAVDGMQIESLSDFVPAPDRDAIQLQLSRVGEAAVLSTLVRVPGRDPRLQDGVATACAFVFALLLGLLALRVRSSSAPPTRAPGAGAVAGEARGPRARRATAVVVAWLVGGGVLLSFPISRWILPGGVDAVIVVVAAALLSTVTEVISGRHRPFRSWSRSVIRTVARAHLPMAAVLGCVLVAVGSTRLDGIVSAQGAWPWQWLVFQSPVVLLASLAFVLAVASPEPVDAWSGQVVGRVQLTLFSGLAAVLFLGGWQLPPLGLPSPAGPVLASGLFLAKALFVSRLARWARPMATGPHAGRITFLVAAVALAASLVVNLLDLPSAVVTPDLGLPAFCVCCALVLYGVMNRRRVSALHLHSVPTEP